MATHQMPATVTGSLGQQSGQQQQQQEGLGRNPASTDTIRAQPTSGPSRGSLNILSSILRAPLPNTHPQNPVGIQTDQSRQIPPKPVGYRSVSPVRVITVPGSLAPVDPKSLSPSRTPTTLPPKKSLSPSRTLYTDSQSLQAVQHRAPQSSPSQRGHNPIPRGQVPHSLPGQIIQIPRSVQGEIPQTLLQQIPAEALFQQYKMGIRESQGAKEIPKGALPEGLTRDMIAIAEQAVNSSPRMPTQIILGRVSPNSSQSQPKPAHQVERCMTPPTHVSTIRRTPSPAHMPIGTEVKAVKVELSVGGGEKQQAVNLSKPHERQTSGGWMHQPSLSKPSLESRMSEEFKYGDLLQSIQRSQDIQSQLLQRGLSPITPSDPLEPTKPWNPKQTVISQAPVSQSQVFQSQLHGRIEGIPPNQGQQIIVSPSGGGFIPIPMSVPLPVSTVYTSTQPRITGSTQMVFPSPGQKIASPKAQRVEPTSTILHRAPSPKTRIIHNPASSVYAQSSAETKQPVVNLVRVSQGHVDVKDSIKVYPGQDRSKYPTPPSLESVTQPGPPNVTITTSSSIFPPEKSLQAQRMARNPFTFPATPPVTLTNEFSHGGRVVQVDQSKASTETVDTNQKQRHRSDDMPCLMPVSPRKDKHEEDDKLIPIPQPYNMRVQILANLPINSTYRPTYRATSVAVHRAKAGCITSAAKSLDILRQNLQKSINKEIKEVIQKYIDKFFKLGLENIKLNNGDNSVSDEHLHAVCRQILEEAKKVYTTETGRQSVSPARDLSDTVSEAGSSGRRSALGRRRHPSDTDSETSLRPPGIKKKKGRTLLSLTGRATPSKLSKEIWKREGPKFDPERLTETTRFLMGSKANKAMGFGATRGRLYMKHPDLYKYNGDQDDKTWLYENHHMPATGGKSYLVVLDDIKELAESEEYRDQSGISIKDIAGFSVPTWMLEKMKHQMLAMRTDLPKLPKHRSRSVTPNEGSAVLPEVESGFGEPKELPFANFSSPKATTVLSTNTDEDLEFLAEAAMEDPSTNLSPFNMTGGFDDGASDLDTLEEDTLNPPI